MADPTSRSERLLTLAVALAAALAPLPILHHWFALLDEGYVLGIADEINRGKTLYRDVNVDAPFPGAFYLLAFWFRWMGTSIEASRYLVHIGFVVYATAFFRIARAFVSRGWAIALVVVLLCYRVWAFPQWQIYGYSPVAATLVLLAVALVLRGARTVSTAWYAGGGLVIGAAVMCKQDYGLAVAGTTGLALLLAPWLESSQRPRVASALAAPSAFGLAASAVLVASLGILAGQGALAGLVQQTFVVPLTYVFEFSGYPRLPDFWSAGQDPAMRADIAAYLPSIVATLWWSPCPGCWVEDLGRSWLYRQTPILDMGLRLIFWAPIAVTGLATALWLGRPLVRRLRGPGSADVRPRLLLLALAAGFLLAFNPPRDWAHLVMVYPPSLLVGAVLLRDALARVPRSVATGARRLLVLATAVLVLATVMLMDDLRREIDYWVPTPRAGVAIDEANGEVIVDLLDYVAHEVDTGRPVPVWPIQPMLGFLAGLEPAAGFSVIWPVQDPSRDEKIIADLERRHAGHVVYSLSQYAKLGSFRENAPRLFDYLADRFAIDRVFSRRRFGPLVTALARRPPQERWGGSIGAGAEVERGRWLTWPFGRVLVPDGGGERVEVALEVPAGGGELRFAYGVDPARWLGLSAGPFTFRVSARAPGSDAAARVLFEATIDPAREPGERRWHPGRIDLSAFRGRRLKLGFEIDEGGVASARGGEPLAGWLEPRVVGREAAALPTREPRFFAARPAKRWSRRAGRALGWRSGGDS